VNQSSVENSNTIENPNLIVDLYLDPVGETKFGCVSESESSFESNQFANPDPEVNPNMFVYPYLSLVSNQNPNPVANLTLLLIRI
jgi:hypothetical protein